MNTSDTVQAFYEHYSYPPVPIATPPHFSATACYRLARYAQSGFWPNDDLPRRALVGGCGNGHELHLVAANSPECQEVIGVDLSRTAVATAQERLAYHKLEHCRVEWADLMQAETLPPGPFDFITSYGVLHHTADPAVALQNLASRLAPDGVMALMIYNASGRQIIYQFRQVLSRLGLDQPDMVAPLLQALQPNSQTYTHLRGNASYYQHPENIADNFLHPQDLPFYVADIPPWLAEAGLCFLDMIPNGQYWCPEAFVSRSNTAFYGRYGQLDRLAQLSLLENLSPTTHTQNIFWCSRSHGRTWAGTFPPYDPEDAWQLNPLVPQQVRLTAPGGVTLTATQADTLQPDLAYQLVWPLIPMPYHTMHLSGQQLQALLSNRLEALSARVCHALAAQALIVRKDSEARLR
ncbi:MAG: methyltransferase domain-containing protein [Synechococcaceae cyanobacterium SM2_3_60]|nr:methyltransferase domain-containing protein [Synechococcaceae cyanobacterium SM2_3_60]